MQQLPGDVRLNYEVRDMISSLMTKITSERYGFDTFKAFVAFLDQADDPREDAKTMSFPFPFYSEDPPISLAGPYLNQLLSNFAGRNGKFWVDAYGRFMRYEKNIWPKTEGLGKKIPILWPFDSIVIKADAKFDGREFEKHDRYVRYDNHFLANFRLCEIDPSDDRDAIYAYDVISKSTGMDIINAVGRDNMFTTPDRMYTYMLKRFLQRNEYKDGYNFIFFVRSRCGDVFMIIWSVNNKACNTVARRIEAIYDEIFPENTRVLCTREFAK